MTPDRIRCEITQLELGLELEDASRYAENVAGRLEIVCDALETIGLTRRAEIMRVWLERWLRIVDLLFEARLAEQQFLSLPDATRSPSLSDATRSPSLSDATRSPSLPDAARDAELEKLN